MRSGRCALAAAILGLAVASPARAETVHVVARGHTLDRIAKRYHTTVDALREANELKPGQRIHPGLKLFIPEKGKDIQAAKKAARARTEKAPARQKDRASADKAAPRSKTKVTETSSRGEPRYARKPKRPGYVRFVRGSEQLDVQLLTRRGKLVPASLGSLGRILRYSPANAKVAIDPRLATLLGTVSDHFGGRTIHVVSGYRPYSPAQYTRHSNHNVGKATDFRVEGVPNSVLRDYCRTFRNAGVGYYPNSTFVHLDVRSTKVFWVDYSRPGERPKYESAAARDAADEAAGDVETLRDEQPPSAESTSSSLPYAIGTEGGSTNTPPAAVQVSDVSRGNHDAKDPAPREGDSQGQ
jgi:uncharacterized protein YcbK (DUF882 family)